MGPGFHTGGFTVAFGHGHSLVIIIIRSFMTLAAAFYLVYGKPGFILSIVKKI